MDSIEGKFSTPHVQEPPLEDATKAKKVVYLPYLLDKVAEENQMIKDEYKKESLKKPVEEITLHEQLSEPKIRKEKEKHHKSKDKCEICKRKRAKREADRKEREKEKLKKALDKEPEQV